MIDPGRYIVIDTTDALDTAVSRLSKTIDHLEREGWTRALSIAGLLVLLAPHTRLQAIQVHRRHILIGDYRGQEPLSNLCGRARSSNGLASDVVEQGWGRYLLVWRDDAHGLSVLRDPTGAIDAVWWTLEGAVIVTDASDERMDPLLPRGLEFDWNSLATLAADVARISDTLPISGLRTLLPGTVTSLPRNTARSVWSPGSVARRSSWDDRPEALADVIDKTVETLVRPHARVLAELSGGLDSAIVASSLTRAGLAGRAQFVTYHPDQSEGDERAHARAVASWLDLPLTEIRKPTRELDITALSSLGSGFRPALHGLDLAYETDISTRLQAQGATGLATGQGGDSLFFQAPDPLILRDRCLRLGPLAIGPRRISSVARWTRRSARQIIQDTYVHRSIIPPDQSAHPWVRDAIDLPPAKRAQVQRFVNAQLFWSDCLRSRSAELLHPLLSQPVVDHCLAIPSDRLVSPTPEHSRDRALVRQAFAGRLPPDHLSRRDKGDLSRFYALLVRDSRGLILDYLADGCLAEQGWFDREALSISLSFDRLISDAASNRFLIWCVIEAWARTWQSRIERLGRSHISIEPGHNPRIHVAQVGGTGVDMALTEIGDERGLPVVAVEETEKAPKPSSVEVTLDQQGRGNEVTRRIERAGPDPG